MVGNGLIEDTSKGVNRFHSNINLCNVIYSKINRLYCV